MHTHIHTHIHADTHTHTHADTHTGTHTHTRTHIHTLTHTHTHVSLANYHPMYHCRVGLALDAYMMPVEDGISDRVEQPLLFINTWTWQWPKNVAKIKPLLDTSYSKVESKMRTAN